MNNRKTKWRLWLVGSDLGLEVAQQLADKVFLYVNIKGDYLTLHTDTKMYVFPSHMVAYLEEIVNEK